MLGLQWFAAPSYAKPAASRTMLGATSRHCFRTRLSGEVAVQLEYTANERIFKCQSSCRWLAQRALRMSAIIGPEAVQRELLSIVSILLKV